MTTGLPYTEVKPGLGWGQVFWVVGGQGAMGNAPRFRLEVKDPPTSGWGQVFVIDRGGKSVTLFSPFTFDAFQVSRNSAEFQSIRPTPFRAEWAAKLLPRRWQDTVNFNFIKDFDTAAVVMRELGLEVPMTSTAAGGGDEAKPRGGKEVEVKLKKPVPRDGRRAQVLGFFLAGEGGKRSIREAMAEIDVSRKNLLSQLYLLQKDHGIGYTIVGDAVQVALPEGCEDPYA